MAGDIKLSEYTFSLPRTGRRGEGVRKPEGSMAKSSYTIPQETQWAMKMLSVELHVKLNELIQEAFTDLLAKYGKR